MYKSQLISLDRHFKLRERAELINTIFNLALNYILYNILHIFLICFFHLEFQTLDKGVICCRQKTINVCSLLSSDKVKKGEDSFIWSIKNSPFFLEAFTNDKSLYFKLRTSDLCHHFVTYI